MAAKQVLVCLGENRRVVSIAPSSEQQSTDRQALLDLIRKEFRGVLHLDDCITLQQKSERWQGMFIDYFDDEIVDGSVFNLAVTRADQIHLNSDDELRVAKSVQAQVEASDLPSVDSEEVIDISEDGSETSLAQSSQSANCKQLRLSLTPCGVKLKPAPSDETEQEITLSDKVREEVVKQSVIYRKENLTCFQKCVNEAAAKISLQNPTLIRKGRRGDLLHLAREKVSQEGFNFQKGKSRSKLYGDADSLSKPKHPKLNEQLRKERLEELNEDVDSETKRIAIKEKRLAQAEAARNYKLCDQLSEEIQELKAAKRAKVREIAIIQAKEKRAMKYQQRSCSGTSTSTSRSMTPSGNTADSEVSYDHSFTPVSAVFTPSSPLSPLFQPNYTKEGCTSSSEPVHPPGMTASQSF